MSPDDTIPQWTPPSESVAGLVRMLAEIAVEEHLRQARKQGPRRTATNEAEHARGDLRSV